MICEICGKKGVKSMPKHMLFKHPKEGTSNVGPSKESAFGVSSINKDILETQVLEKGWSWGEINICRQCLEEYPEKLMAFHMHVKHGM